ncbi:MAG: Gfo/Idh/MocA family oxidoreductase [Candidatus Promineifilaceae bacterium]|nr:Gfo/Idh/MocA family oxidoreductase [Candidatus Promineifilaceae bacterium]
MTTIRFAFAGTGFSRVHARFAQDLPGVELVAVVNHRPDSMAAFAADFHIPRQYATIEALLADGDVDAISINTPNYLHAPQTIAALEAGVHVLVEKPMAMNAEEARRMLETAERGHALLMVAHCYRFDAEAQWLRTRVAAGELGRIIRTRSYGVHSNWGPGGWFTKKKLAGGGAIADMGIHALDTIRFILGDPLPVSVYARIGTFYGDYDVDDTGVILVNWDNGVTSVIETGWWQPYADKPNAGTQLYGTKGFGELFPTRLLLPDLQNDREQIVEGGFDFPRSEAQNEAKYGRQLAYFLKCIEQGCTPVPGGLEGWINMLVVDAAYESSRKGEVVEIKAQMPGT